MKNLPQSHRVARKVNLVVYSAINFDKNGWADAKKHKPRPFDLVTIQTTTGKNFNGWWDNSSWKGLRLRKKDDIIQWKRRMYEQIK